MNSDYRGKTSVPFGRSYWVIVGNFLAGCYPGSQSEQKAYHRLKAILAHGIRHFVNLMEPQEVNKGGKAFVPYRDQLNVIARSMGIENVTCERMPIEDLSIPSEAEMVRILDHIEDSISEDRPVYVHCWGGRGRTGTVVGCYLARHGFASGGGVLKLIDDLRKDTEDQSLPSPETSPQIDMVLEWGEGQ